MWHLWHKWKTVRSTKAKVSGRFSRDLANVVTQDVVLEHQRCEGCGKDRALMHDIDGNVTEIHPSFVTDA